MTQCTGYPALLRRGKHSHRRAQAGNPAIGREGEQMQQGHPTHIIIPPTGYRPYAVDLTNYVEVGKPAALRVGERKLRCVALPIEYPKIGTPTEARAILSKWLSSGENETVPVFVRSAQEAVAEGADETEERIGQLRTLLEIRFRPRKTPPPEPKPEPPAPEIKFKPLF